MAEEILLDGWMLYTVFVAFGLMIGILFGFFGMGGSFLVTPALLQMGYPASIAVGSGMAFVFGTAVIATLKHHDLGQVDHKLGAIMILGTATGIEVGRIGVYYLQDMGLAGGVIGFTYVLLLGGIGVLVTREALTSDGESQDLHSEAEAHADGGEPTFSDHEPPEIAKKITGFELPPMVTLRGDIRVSVWVVTAIAFSTGVLSGFLGVGGGFIRMPAMMYGIGVPVPVAVGTDLFEIVFSGGIGSFLYAQRGGVDLSIVVPLLAGSALGARIGSGATEVVNADDIKIYFGGMLLAGSLAVGVGELGTYTGVQMLETASFVMIMIAALGVSVAVLYNAARAVRS